MLRLLSYVIRQGVVTRSDIPETLPKGLQGFPLVSDVSCESGCSACEGLCPTKAIKIDEQGVSLDRGACIACGDCIFACPSSVLQEDLSTATFGLTRDELVVRKHSKELLRKKRRTLFSESLAVRVVSTGCAACDLEVGAAANPIFDAERFGMQIVASPRFADALLVTGPVPKNMHDALYNTYAAMSSPKVVIASGTCAISGGVHRYASECAQGAGAIIPVDVFIPGCPPHPWSIIQGLRAARLYVERR